jgi:DNA-binding MarR family transcriptional regulator
LFSLLSIVATVGRRAQACAAPERRRADVADDSDLHTWATGRLLSTAARFVEHAWDAHLAQWGLNHAGCAVLFLLQDGPCSQRRLAGPMHVQDQTMSRVVERLERRGYVTRARSAADRRRVLVTVTDAGRAALREATAGDRADAIVADALPEAATAELRGHLVTLVQRLGDQRPGVAGRGERHLP